MTFTTGANMRNINPVTGSTAKPSSEILLPLAARRGTLSDQLEMTEVAEGFYAMLDDAELDEASLDEVMSDFMVPAHALDD